MIQSRAQAIKCPKHQDELLHRLKYQVANGKGSPLWKSTEWYYCEKCEVPVMVRVSVEILAKAK